MGTIQIDGSTPKLTIGNATAEDATILFDGNAQDFYIALDDSADDLLIGLGSTVGTTPAIAIDENLKVNIPVTTASTSASTGSLTTGGGAGIGADLYVGDDVYLITDSAVLGFGADKDTLLTHTDGTGLTLNSTNKLCFNDTSQFVQGSSATVLSIGATDEIDLTATAVDLNGTLNVSGIATFQAAPVFPDGSLALADLDIDGGTDIGAAVVDADLFIIDDGAGGTNRKVAASRLKTYAGSDIIKLATAGSTTNASTLDIQQVFDDSLYGYYILHARLRPETAGDDLRFSFLNSSNALETSAVWYGIADGGHKNGSAVAGDNVVSHWGSAFAILLDDCKSALYNSIQIDMTIVPRCAEDDMKNSTIQWQAVYWQDNSSTERVVNMSGGSTFTDTDNWDGGGFRLFWSGDDFDEYEYVLYGVKR